METERNQEEDLVNKSKLLLNSFDSQVNHGVNSFDNRKEDDQ